jgi:glutamine amidotransferase
MQLKVGILEVGYGNIRSVLNCVETFTNTITLVKNPNDVRKIDKLIIPGVGSFSTAMESLRKLELEAVIKEKVLSGNLNILGICLGAQLLFDTGEEGGSDHGLGLLEGKVTQIKNESGTPLNHTGWSDVIFKENLGDFSRHQSYPFYFNHNYKIETTDKNVIGICPFICDAPVIVGNQFVLGVQFHPEKSQHFGTKIFDFFFKNMVINVQRF